MKKTLLTLCFFTVCYTVFPQRIEMHNTFGGARFELDTIVLTMRQVKEIMSVDPLASADFKAAQTYNGLAGVLGFGGGFLLLFPIGTAIAGGEPEWGLAGGGAVLLLATIPLTKAFKKRAASAVAIHNSQQPASRLRPSFYFTGRGGAFVLKF